MSEDFVDVTWRGLEVVKKARLRGTGAHSAYLEHATPMPTGSQLTIRTADGHELAAIVSRVQEQIGGRSEPPGVEIAIEATGAAATWWLARAEAAAALAQEARASAQEAQAAQAAAQDPAQASRHRAASRETAAMTAMSMPDLVPPPMPEEPPTPIETAPTRPSARATAVTMPPPMHAPRTEPPAITPDPRKTDLMFAAAVDEVEDNGDAIPTGIDDSIDRPGDEIVDDGRRTMIMPAVDIAAIVEAGARPDSDDDTNPGNGTGGGDKKKPKGKRRRGR